MVTVGAMAVKPCQFTVKVMHDRDEFSHGFVNRFR